MDAKNQNNHANQTDNQRVNQSNNQAREEISAEYEELANQLYSLNQELNMLNSQKQELERSRELLRSVINNKQELENETLIPLAAGIYAKAGKIDVKQFFVNVGHKVMVKKTPEETLELLDKRMEEFENYESRLKDIFDSLQWRLEEIQTLMREQDV